MELSFRYVSNKQEAALHLQQSLIEKITTHNSVVWLVPGGSNIALSVDVMRAIPQDLRSQLTILQTDERFGAYNHPDSNWLQLHQAGFNPTGAKTETILTKDNLSLEDSVKRYDEIVRRVLKSNAMIIGQFGIGVDGHIAGILPGSPAVDAQDYVIGYETEQFTRVTLTPRAISRINMAYAFVFGESKKVALNNLYSKNLSLSEQPSQILKQIEPAYIYSDQIKKLKGKQ